MFAPYARYCNPKTRKAEYLAWYKDSSGAIHYDRNQIRPQKNSAGAIFFLQGLNGFPFIWESYIDAIKKQNPKIDCFAFDVYKSGNCRLKDSVKPVFEAMEHYFKQNPNGDIVIIGMSRGGQAAAKLERLFTTKTNRIKNIMMATPHWGTKFMNWSVALGLTKLFCMHPAAVAELKFASPKAKQRLDKWRTSAKNAAGEREREFLVSRNDDRLVPCYTAFPEVDPNDIHRIYTKYAHTSTLRSQISRDVIKSALAWFK